MIQLVTDFIIESKEITNVICIRALFERIIAFQLIGNCLDLCKFINVILIRITQPQIGAYRILILIMLCRTIAISFEKTIRFLLERINTFIHIFAFIKELDEHCSDFFLCYLRKLDNHFGRKVIY